MHPLSTNDIAAFNHIINQIQPSMMSSTSLNQSNYSIWSHDVTSSSIRLFLNTAHVQLELEKPRCACTTGTGSAPQLLQYGGPIPTLYFLHTHTVHPWLHSFGTMLIFLCDSIKLYDGKTYKYICVICTLVIHLKLNKNTA